MSARAGRLRRIAYRLRHPPIGYQHGRRARFLRLFPMVCWTYYGLVAHTTPRGLLFGLIGAGPTALFLLVGLDSPVQQAAYALLAWIAVCVFTGLIGCPRLRVTVRMPVRVECGSRFETRYTVTNLGRRRARDLAVDTLIFSDWMSLRRQRARLDALHAGETETLTASGHALARGIYTLPALRYDSDFPCGFWRWGKTDTRERSLSVYPRYTRLESLEIPLGNRNRADLAASRERAREALEFHGCREFREGDALRHVHPRSSARLGVPVVKEFQTEGRSRTAVLVDTRMRRAGHAGLAARLRREDPVEAALALAAAVADALSATDRVLELLVAGPQVYRFVSSGRIGYLEEVLDLLAAVEPCGTDPLRQLEPLLLEEIRSIQSVCLILTGWDARRAALVQEIRAREIGLKVLLLTSDGRAGADLPEEVTCLAVRDVLRGEVSRL
ncbi:MAG: DUF58 domain-containing protein [Kiritimatiellia bacterium]|jgi:uncharacterized protein (DUF58 family)|nr:DUF58 domain-containing protein [Kiritimatiellia bacterium]